MTSAESDARPRLLGDCDHCPLSNERLVSGYGVGGGLAVVGDAPSAGDVSRKQPFMGDSGRLLRTVLGALGADPDEGVYYTNSSLCRPLVGTSLPLDAVKACNSRLHDVELPMVQPSKILAVGASALTAILRSEKESKITKWRGRMFYTDVAGVAVPTVATFHPMAVLRDPDLFRDFAGDIEKLLTRDKPFEPSLDCLVPETEQACLDYLTELKKATRLSLDLETWGLDPNDGIISLGLGAVLAGEKREGVTVVIPATFLRVESIVRVLWGMLNGSEWSGVFVFHNAKFDLKFLDVLFGQPVRPLYADTMLAHYALDERPGGQFTSHSLKDLARIHFDADDYAFDFDAFYKKPESERDMNELYWYHALDCYYTIMLLEDLADEAREEGSYDEWVQLCDQTLIPGSTALKEIERHGALIDREYLLVAKLRLEAELQSMQTELAELVAKTSTVTDFNPASPKQVGELLFGAWKLPSRPSTDRETLQGLIKVTKDPRFKAGLQTIIDHRLKSKVKSTYIEGILARLDSSDRLHTDLKLHGTSTGRLSSSNPNLQNIPTLMGQEIRDAFIPPEGWTYVVADYSQLELRIAAMYSKDPVMSKTFIDGEDIHVQVAAQMFRKEMKDVSPHERYLAKYVDFGILYGRGAPSLAGGWEMDYLEEKLGGKRWSIDEAEYFLAKFLSGFPKLARWMNEQKARGLSQQYTTTPTGRRRRFPLIPNGARGSIERQCVNSPVQGLASDVCLRALTRLHFKLDPAEAWILFPVHDAINLEVRTDVLDRIVPLIRETMESDLPFETTIPFPVKIEAGPRWGQCKEIKA